VRATEFLCAYHLESLCVCNRVPVCVSFGVPLCAYHMESLRACNRVPVCVSCGVPLHATGPVCVSFGVPLCMQQSSCVCIMWSPSMRATEFQCVYHLESLCVFPALLNKWSCRKGVAATRQILQPSMFTGTPQKGLKLITQHAYCYSLILFRGVTATKQRR
jgi:hypothetical protein